LINDLDYIGHGPGVDSNERRAKDLPALNLYYVEETKEERFDTSICEILNKTVVSADATGLIEAWNWTNIETMPWFYTEMYYPTATVDYKISGYPNTNLDYLLTSSFIAPNSGIGERGNDVRVKFVYDPTDGTGLYVNTAAGAAYDKADTNYDCIISMPELMTAIGWWKSSTYPDYGMLELMTSIGRWKAGVPYC